MKSDLHAELQKIGQRYAINKSYWATEEVPTTAGICDVWGISRVLEYTTIAIEVKVSKKDFCSPSQKWKEAATYSNPQGNMNYILCPSNLIAPEDVHEAWGLLWWDGERIKNKKQPKFVEMTDRRKLQTLIHFLNNGTNHNKPVLQQKMV